MTLIRDELDRVGRLNEGDLEEAPFGVVLFGLAKARRSALLELQRGSLQKEILFEDGHPVDCRSNLVHETLSRFIVSTGRLDASTADACYRESVTRSLRFGDVLIEKDLIDPEELLKILQQNLASKLLDVFSWHTGTWRIDPRIHVADSPLRVNVPQLVFIGVSKFATQDQIDGSIGPLIGTQLTYNPEPVCPIDELKVPKKLKPIIEYLRSGPVRIDELAAIEGIRYEDLTRTLYALTVIEVVVPADQVENQAPKAATVPIRRMAEPAPPPQRESARPLSDESRRDLMELALNHRRKDPFELLGADPDGSLDHFRDSYLRFAEMFAPWKFSESLSDKARDIFLAGARAFAEIWDPKSRALLLDHRREREAREQASKAANDFKIQSDLLDPVVQFEKGMELVAAGKHEKALEQLDFAADLDPQNLRYSSERAFCRFVTNQSAHTQSALEELREVLRIDPKNGLALYFSGEILRYVGKFNEAESFLKRAIKPMAPDRRPIDALKDLNRDRNAVT